MATTVRRGRKPGEKNMGTIHAVIDLSQDLYSSLSSYGLTKEKIVGESRKLLALKYYREQLLSTGKAAELSGLSKCDFIEFLSDNGVPVIDHDELSSELKSADVLAKALST